MPGLIAHGAAKRKRSDKTESSTAKKKSKKGLDEYKGLLGSHDIQTIEGRILESRRNYNDIVKLIDLVRDDDKASTRREICLALCRVFSRLFTAGALTIPDDLKGNERMISQWLNARYREYQDILCGILENAEASEQGIALGLLMHLMKEEAGSTRGGGLEKIWKKGTFLTIIRALLLAKSGTQLRGEFVQKYIEEFDDVRFYTFHALRVLEQNQSVNTNEHLDNRISLLGLIGTPAAGSEDKAGVLYLTQPSNQKNALISAKSLRKEAGEAWMVVLRQELTKMQRKTLLGLVSRIAPWLPRPEMLMDFLTDAFSTGGSTALMAISGLFYLVQEKNLDYPQFYEKLYSLLDPSILHSKHRSRFLRLLETFLASTHLPAALVASFIKRLSRLCLHAPPSAVVAIVPWIYNLLKSHLVCTFMVHRNQHAGVLQEERMDDPFDMYQTNPLQSKAIESSLWEVETLQSHYHPGVATVARIISEQFTKQAYNIEDFLDHSYASMIDAELTKTIKKPPVVEYEIPRKLFTRLEDSNATDSLLVKLYDFGA